MKPQRFGDFLHLLNEKRLDVTDTVQAYVKPTGALCTVTLIGETVTLANGNTRFVNDPLGKYLAARGITGTVLVNVPSRERNVPKWLTYQNHHADFEEWSKYINIFTFNQQPTTNEGHVQIKPLTLETFKLDNLVKDNDALSIEDEYDGLIIEACNVEGEQLRFHMLPTRYCEGTVEAVVWDDKERPRLVARIERDGRHYTTIVRDTTLTLRRQLADRPLKELIGHPVRIQYTSFIPGDRLRNFGSPLGLFLSN